MPKTVALTGNSACAQAMRQINPDVVAAYPITPQTTIVEEFSTFVAKGLVDTEYVTVESEHSAMSACVGASAAGSRVMTTTSSQGLALMWEVLYIASALRLPIVMHNVNRTLSGPINIHCDHQDSMGARDSGWIQIFCEDAQEAYDTTIQAIRIAEDNRVRLPVMICFDGFIISHAIDRLDLLDDEVVKKFVGDFEPLISLLDTEKPVTVGPFDGLYGYFFEFRRAQELATLGSLPVIAEVGKEFGEVSGRHYGLFEPYKLEDAELAVVVMGSTAGTAKFVVDQLRENGVAAGVLKIRSYRPFPAREIAEALSGVKAIAAMDRSLAPGAIGAPVFQEIRSALYDNSARVPVIDYIYGLGGRDVPPAHIEKVFSHLAQIAKSGKIDQVVNYLGLKE
ncbi:MAG: pyruvate ferredoxin oxidoreductase [Actinomycetota bacterium]|nr:pyruvate ferredoxin oxidoreductase [Actinomycetota bacterium]